MLSLQELKIADDAYIWSFNYDKIRNNLLLAVGTDRHTRSLHAYKVSKS